MRNRELRQLRTTHAFFFSSNVKGETDRSASICLRVGKKMKIESADDFTNVVAVHFPREIS
ncbi:hypothetical protein OAA27_01700 [bacterium]|nr:hypothetical protein [bacterium]